MTTNEIIKALAHGDAVYPKAALEAAELHREALTPPLLEALLAGVEDPEGISDDASLFFCFAVYLLAKWREPQAHPLLLRWLALPDQQAYTLGGDTVTEIGSRVLAMTCGGNLEGIKALIVNREADEFSRSAALDALVWLVAYDELPHAEVEAYFLWLAETGLVEDDLDGWTHLAGAAADMGAIAVFPRLYKAFDQGLIEDMLIDVHSLKKIEREPRGASLRRFKAAHPFFTDLVKETSWLGTKQQPVSRTIPAPTSSVTSYHNGFDPYLAPPKIGRNDACPCGSGKKYKKCCG